MLLGIDVGTGSSKALLLGPDGAVAGEAASPHPVSAPRPGWAETDPEAWWASAVAAVRAAVGDRGGAVEAIGLSGQMHGVVLAGDDGGALRPAILWADGRSAGQLGAYARVPGELAAVLGNPVVAGMAGPTLLWLRDHEPEAYARAAWALQPKDWLRARLTGTVETDPSDASATLLYDVEADAWSGAIAEALGLRRDLLAPVREAAEPAGGLLGAAATALGLRAGIPVAVGAADTAAGGLGTGLLGTGEAQLTVGTGAQLVADLAVPRRDGTGRTHLFRAAAPGGWYAMAAMQNAGLALEWCLRALGRDWEWAYAHAFEQPPGANGLTFLPYLSGERTPHLDPAARGGWIGLGLEHDPAAMMRAAFEGVAYAIRDGLDALEDAGHAIGALRLVGGGTADPRWRRLLASALERPLTPVAVAAGSARGAALLAGAAIGRAPFTGRTTAFEPVLPGDDAPAYSEGLRRFRASAGLARVARG